jgi:hypothetical protein
MLGGVDEAAAQGVIAEHSGQLALDLETSW